MVAILDGGSFVLPYDAGLIRLLSAHGIAVDFYASRTRYNGELLASLATLPGVRLHLADVSGTVAPRWRGALAYVGLLLRLAARSRRYSTINLQFSVAWPVEWPFLFLWRRRLVVTLHNPVPHGFRGARHRPTGWIAGLARELVFLSDFSRDDFLRRDGRPPLRARSTLLPHGLLPPVSGQRPVPYAPMPAPPTSVVFWGNVQPYKGVELFAELARSAAVRRRGLRLEVHGAWSSPAMAPLREELVALGVVVVDRFLDGAEVQALLGRDALFLLPYRSASQSGALYTLLHAGRCFACSDIGDLGDFMRRFGLEDLLLRDRSADAVLDCLDRLRAAPGRCAEAFATAQRQSAWDAIWPAAAAVYGGRGAATPGETIAAR